MRSNLILDTDSYKASHEGMYPPGMDSMFSYLESRGGLYKHTVFFGLQYLLREYLSTPITPADVIEAEMFFKDHGEPFNAGPWNKCIEKFGGYLPIIIRAVEEGTVVPTHNILMSVESSGKDPEVASIVSYMETMLMRMWYPITVATTSYECKRVIMRHLKKTSDDPKAEIGFKLHDFGGRGVSSRESAGIGGAAHLANFMGSDTVEGIRLANLVYHSQMSGFSIPATEHSTITSWGRDKEDEAYANLVKRFCKPGALVACVSDSYDLYRVVEQVWGGDIGRMVESSGATLVIRPDSGDPASVVCNVLDLMKRKVGMSMNSKGYYVLPKHFRIIQGDGVNPVSIDEILTKMELSGYSGTNIAFGMGGALLQKVDRDTQKFAYKCSSCTVNGVKRDVFKDPVTDHGKMSKRGELDLIENERGDFQTVTRTSLTDDKSLLKVVYKPGLIVLNQDLQSIRGRIDAALDQE